MIQVNRETNEIFVYGIIGPSWADMAGADEYVAALALFRNQDIHVRINTPGGSAFEAIAMFNATMRHSGKVTTWNDSLAASGGSLLLLSGSVRMVANPSRVMIHRARGIANGTGDDLHKAGDTMLGLDKDLVALYSDRTGIDAAKIQGMIDAETWFSADEAIASGFATEIFKPKKEIESAIVPKNWYENTPEMYLKPEFQLQFIKDRPRVTEEMTARQARFVELTGKHWPV